MGKWQEEKDKLDKKKVLIFAESPEKTYEETLLDLPREITTRTRPDTKIGPLTIAKDNLLPFISDDETRELYEDIIGYSDTSGNYTIPNLERNISEQLWEDNPNMTGDQEDELFDERVLHAYNTLGTLMGPSIEWWNPSAKDFPEDLMRPDPDKDDFTGQANWWKQSSGPDTDVAVVPFRGREELDAELKRLIDEGYLSTDADAENVSAIMMGHYGDEGTYGGVGPYEFNAVWDKNFISNKIDDVTLGSCYMADNPLACKSWAEATDAPTTSQHSASWGTGSIGEDVSNPNLPIWDRVLTKGVPTTTYDATKTFSTSDDVGIEMPDASTWEDATKQFMIGSDSVSGTAGEMGDILRKFSIKNPDVDINRLLYLSYERAKNQFKNKSIKKPGSEDFWMNRYFKEDLTRSLSKLHKEKHGISGKYYID